MKTIIQAIIFSLFLGLCYPISLIAQSCPCCSEAFRQFDFWLGDWETYQNKNLAGTNNIVLLQDSCVIQENWKSAKSNYTGTSYNFYDPITKKWHQTWVDNQGGYLLLNGTLINGSMILKSDPTKDVQGNVIINKVTWTPNADGTVRQLWEVSKDKEKTWNTVFDGLYRKK